MVEDCSPSEPVIQLWIEAIGQCPFHLRRMLSRARGSPRRLCKSTPFSVSADPREATRRAEGSPSLAISPSFFPFLPLGNPAPHNMESAAQTKCCRQHLLWACSRPAEADPQFPWFPFPLSSRPGRGLCRASAHCPSRGPHGSQEENVRTPISNYPCLEKGIFNI